MTQTTQTATIQAECHSDDYAVKQDFDATLWFEQASAEQIVALADCGWGGDYPADAVAHFMADHDDQIAAMFTYIEAAGKIKDVGFECHVNEERAMAWLTKNRPGLDRAIQRK